MSEQPMIRQQDGSKYDCTMSLDEFNELVMDSLTGSTRLEDSWMAGTTFEYAE